VVKLGVKKVKRLTIWDGLSNFFPKKQLEVSKATIFFSSPVVASLAIHGRKKLDSSKATILFPSSTLRMRHTK